MVCPVCISAGAAALASIGETTKDRDKTKEKTKKSKFKDNLTNFLWLVSIVWFIYYIYKKLFGECKECDEKFKLNRSIKNAFSFLV